MSPEEFLDPARPAQARADDLLARMNLDEKLAQLGGVWVTDLLRQDQISAEVVPHGIGQVTRIGGTTGLLPAQSASLMNDIQRAVMGQSRHGIPVLVHEESLAGYSARDATVFPQAIGLASSWDTGLVEEVAGVIRRQMMAVGARQGLAPVLDVARDPRWGRVEETYGEDPVLTGQLGAAYVRGLQSADLRTGVLATAKHFLGHAMSEGGRNHAPVHLGPRELREVYAEPFAAAIRDGQLGSVMNAYSSVDGLPCAGSRHILTELLRTELGFSGIVVADYFSVSLLMTYHHVAADKAEAGAMALAAGLDVELPVLDCFGKPLRSAVEAGLVPMALVDAAVGRVLTAKFRLGLFESPYVDVTSAALAFRDPANAILARRAATAGIVLLANDGVLPLPPAAAVLAVVGPAADDRRLLQGDYHYPAHQEILVDAAGGPADRTFLVPRAGGAFSPGPYYTRHVTPLAGLTAAAPAGTTIRYAPGCQVSGDDRTGFTAAVAAAEQADVAIMFLAGRSGLTEASTVGESRDATDLRLTGPQEDLVDAVCATGTPVVVVVLSGRVHTLGAIADRAAALIQAWPPGEQGGSAVADILFGKVSPAGRLPVSLPRSVGQIPRYHGHRAGGSTSMTSGAYTDGSASPLFPFGHGLSYTTFTHHDLAISATDTESALTIGVSVTNTGRMRGDEVVQLYATDVVASVVRPEQQLIGFARVSLEAGDTHRVTFSVHPSRLAFYDERMSFVVQPGEFRFSIGASATDIRATASVVLSGQVASYAQRSVVPLTVAVSEPLPLTEG
ncbi:MAG TPA: glycoside hydrolase family 3 N-terminal domain-containing protein [Streptosporangiaceae bacterium]|nr:glycoside hydrolase family 3 N-terminal domain-containing protein [Streptosporangiaceae bacterium]